MFRPLEELIHAYFARTWPIATCENSLSGHLPVWQMPEFVFVRVRRASAASGRLIFMLGGDESHCHERLGLLLAMINKSCFN